ncbi:MAG: c-type cytochrome [Terriglobia bacterium]
MRKRNCKGIERAARRVAALVIGAAILAALSTLKAWCAQSGGTKTPTQGKTLFVSRCGMCHGIDGRGGEHAPDIATRPAVKRLSDAQLQGIVENGIPSGGMPSFRALGRQDIKSVVEYLRTLQGSRAAVVVAGNPAHGKALFFGSAGCSTCHMIRGRGGFLAPDLTAYALSHSPPQLRTAIVNPNQNLSPAADTVIAVTRDGRKLTGVARNEDNFSVQLQTADGRFHLLMKSGLASLRHEPRSLMPSDYASRLSAAELNDLISYLVKASEGTSEPARHDPAAHRL